MKTNETDKLFSNEYLDQLNRQEQTEQGPVTIFGLTFKNDEERRQYFREELRRRLPELRKIEGFPIGEDDDIINLSDPPYYTACPNPWLNDFIAQWEEEKKQLQIEGMRKADFEVKEPYASDKCFCPYRATFHRAIYTQGAASLCPGLGDYCPFGALPFQLKSSEVIF